jgi:hypothetical protein
MTIRKNLAVFQNTFGHLQTTPIINPKTLKKYLPLLHFRMRSANKKKRGFKFVGSTVIYAYMQATDWWMTMLKIAGKIVLLFFKIFMKASFDFLYSPNFLNENCKPDNQEFMLAAFKWLTKEINATFDAFETLENILSPKTWPKSSPYKPPTSSSSCQPGFSYSQFMQFTIGLPIISLVIQVPFCLTLNVLAIRNNVLKFWLNVTKKLFLLNTCILLTQSIRLETNHPRVCDHQAVGLRLFKPMKNLRFIS